MNTMVRDLSADEMGLIGGGNEPDREMEEIVTTASRLPDSGSGGGFGSNNGPVSGGFGGSGGGGGGSAPTQQERDQAQYERDQQAAQAIADREEAARLAALIARNNSGLRFTGTGVRYQRTF